MADADITQRLTAVEQDLADFRAELAQLNKVVTDALGSLEERGRPEADQHRS